MERIFVAHKRLQKLEKWLLLNRPISSFIAPNGST